MDNLDAIYSQIVEAKCHIKEYDEQTFGIKNRLKCRIGTSDFCDGDTENKTRVVFSLIDESNTDMRVMVDGVETIHPHKIEIAFGGDAEFRAFAEILCFAYSRMYHKLPKDIFPEM